MRKSYFLISVSSRQNLDLCVQYAMAGFMNNVSGAWTFNEIQEGDFVSFLYGAKAHNLYGVAKRAALENAETLPPWAPITFQQSKRTYYFPFRLLLEPIRRLEEPLVRAEFAYVAENLLLRGGYRRTHFQADQTTLQAVSQMGTLWDGNVPRFQLHEYPTFIPRFTRERSKVSPPAVFPLHEFILQCLVRRYLADEKNLGELLAGVNMQPRASEWEVLGEKAFPQGHVDLLVKEATPMGKGGRVIIEVKVSTGTARDLDQLTAYAAEIGRECAGTVLVARDFTRATVRRAREMGVRLATYTIERAQGSEAATFDELRTGFRLTLV